MDTEAIAMEIVTIRNRLRTLDELVDTEEDEVGDERARLRDRLRHLQNKLASDDPTEGPAEPEHIQYLPPA